MDLFDMLDQLHMYLRSVELPSSEAPLSIYNSSESNASVIGMW